MENKIINLQVNDNINNTENSVKSLKAQLREAQNEVNTLSEKFGATSREAVQAAKQAAILKDRIGDAKNLTDAFNPDAKFRALTSSLSGVTGGFAALQGGMALFGQESDDVQKTLLKVQSAMALSQGIQSVGESVDSFRQLGAVIKSTSVVQGVLTAATAAYNFVNTAATTGLKLFRAALISTGIGALVVGVGLLISNFDKVKTVILNLIPGLANVGKFIGGIVDSITDFVGATSDASRALDKLKKDADNTLAVNKKFMQEHGDQVDEYTKKKIEAKNAYANAIKEDGADQVALAKKLNRELADIEFSRGDEKRKIQKEANEKAAADRKAEKERLQKEAAAEKTKFDEQTKSDLELLRQANLNKDLEDSSRKRGLLDEQISILEEGVAAVEVTETKTTEAITKNAEAQKKIEELKTQARIEQAERGAALLTNISDLIGKDTAAGKVAAVAATTINTYAAAQTAFLNAQKNPISILGPAYPYISAGLAIAGGLKNVQAILSVPTPSGGGGGSAPSGSAGMGSGPSAPQFNVVGASSTSQLAQTIGTQQNTPVQAYVVSNDVTTAQALNRNIIRGASL
jgi:uncharacterized membrane protein required for colicin V production